jgi:AcrR family transcriptional regulator
MERTRQLIAEKAFELFTENGFHHTTVEQIAAAAEVGPRTLYRYYPTKEALVVKFVEVNLFAALDNLRAQPLDMPLPEALYALVDTVINVTAANAERVLAVYDLVERTPSVQAQFSDLWSNWRREVAAEVSRRHSGRSSDLTGDLAAAYAMVIIDVSLRHWAESRGQVTMRRLVNRAVDLMRAGDIPIPTPAAK